MEQDVAIVTEGLTKCYSKKSVVNNLDLEVMRGQVFGFLGPNGAGKTTTIRMLLGLVKPTAGKIQILGHNLFSNREMIAKKVGAIVETPAFYSYMTGRENLKVLMQSSNISASSKRIDYLLEMVGLKGREKEPVKQYSLGMKQRLGIAATLLSEPEILFLDEPTNGLDPAGTVEMRSLIINLSQQNYTIFLSSHLLNEVELMCTDVVIIQKGEKRLQGKMKELLAQGKEFAIEATPASLAIAVLQNYCQTSITVDANGWIVFKAERFEVPTILRLLIEKGVQIYQVQERRNSLEKLFLELTGQPSESFATVKMEVSL